MSLAGTPIRRLRTSGLSQIGGMIVMAAAIVFGTMPQAMALDAPIGPAILTIVGDITETNRSPFNEAEDSLFKHHERRFDKAAAFDHAMLEKLGMHEITVSYVGWPKPVRFQGPWLMDVLTAVGAKGGTVAALALDGFGSEIGKADLATQDWLLAIKKNGEYLGIGQRGPAWLVYARRDGKAATADDEGHWPWAVFLLEVR
jgi:hypothetical protein